MIFKWMNQDLLIFLQTTNVVFCLNIKKEKFPTHKCTIVRHAAHFNMHIFMRQKYFALMKE